MENTHRSLPSLLQRECPIVAGLTDKQLLWLAVLPVAMTAAIPPSTAQLWKSPPEARLA
jgi:ABC-type amino acid transport system permease subunit